MDVPKRSEELTHIRGPFKTRKPKIHWFVMGKPQELAPISGSPESFEANWGALGRFWSRGTHGEHPVMQKWCWMVINWAIGETHLPTNFYESLSSMVKSTAFAVNSQFAKVTISVEKSSICKWSMVSIAMLVGGSIWLYHVIWGLPEMVVPP